MKLQTNKYKIEDSTSGKVFEIEAMSMKDITLDEVWHIVSRFCLPDSERVTITNENGESKIFCK